MRSTSRSLAAEEEGKPLNDPGRQEALREALAQSEERFRLFIEHTPAAVAMFDREMRYIIASRQWYRAYEITDQEIIGKSHYDIFPDIPERWRQIHDHCLTGHNQSCDEDLFERADGSKIWIQWEIQPWYQTAEKVGGIIMFTQVITERKESEARQKKLQQKLFQAEKLNALGRFAAGIAHDLNNTLGAISGHLQILKGDSALSSKRSGDAVEMAQFGCDRAARLVDQILCFTRKGKYQPEIISLSEAVKESLAFLRGGIGDRIELTVSGESEELVMVDRGQLQQVITNLIMNAHRAMSGKGRLELLFQPELRSSVEANESAAPGRYLRLSVRDSGRGISPKHLQHVFDPFFTTQESGEGLGLGLAMVYGIMQNHGGWVEVESELGKGSVFHLFFPIVEQKQEPSDSVSEHSLSQEKQGSIVLVVDDEKQLSDLMARFLSSHKIQSKCFTSPVEALRWFKNHSHEVSLVLLDMQMPGLSGEQVFEELRRVQPNLPISLMSGYASDERVEELLEKGARQFLKKPFRYEEVVSDVKRLLAAQKDD